MRLRRPHRQAPLSPRSWSCGWSESGDKARKGNHNSKIAEGWERGGMGARRDGSAEGWERGEKGGGGGSSASAVGGAGHQAIHGAAEAARAEAEFHGLRRRERLGEPADQMRAVGH